MKYIFVVLICLLAQPIFAERDSSIRKFIPLGLFSLNGNSEACQKIEIEDYSDLALYPHIVMVIGQIKLRALFQLYSEHPDYRFPQKNYQRFGDSLKIKFQQNTTQVGHITLVRDSKGLKRVKVDIVDHAFKDGPVEHHFDCFLKN